MDNSVTSGFNEFMKHVKSGNVDGVRNTFKLEYLAIADEDGRQPFDVACQEGHAVVVEFLLQHKCDIETHDKWERRPLHLVCRYGHVEVVKLLLQHKCDIEARSNDVWRPLHYACQYGHVEIVKLLLQNKCDFADSYDSLMRILQVAKSPAIMNLLTAWKKNQSMCSIAWEIELKCDSGCSHTSCFISSSIGDLKKKENTLGEGSFGIVYKVTQLQRTFAIKIIKINDDAKNIEMHIEEYRNILKHENIIRYFGSKTESDKMAIFMEYMPGGSLHNQIIEKGALPHDTIAKYSKKILLAVAFIHDKNIVHRDIKPQNILLNSGGELLKLSDFGVRRILMTMSTVSTQNANRIIGTPNYVAPEIFKGEQYKFLADIWSIGVTVVEMLTGNHPFHTISPLGVQSTICQLEAYEFTPAQPMTDDLDSFVNQMVQCDPSKRATAAQLLKCQFINPASAKP